MDTNTATVKIGRFTLKLTPLPKRDLPGARYARHASGMEDVLSKHGDALTKALRRELRRSNEI